MAGPEISRRKALGLAVAVASEVAAGAVGFKVGGDVEKRRQEDRTWPLGRWVYQEGNRFRVSDAPTVFTATFQPRDLADGQRRIIVRNGTGFVSQPTEEGRDDIPGSPYLLENYDQQVWNDGRPHAIELRVGAINTTFVAPVVGEPLDRSSTTGELIGPTLIDYSGVDINAAIWYSLVNEHGGRVTSANQPIRPGQRGFYLTPTFVDIAGTPQSAQQS